MALFVALIASVAIGPQAVCDGVTYTDDLTALWVPTSEVETALHIQRDSKTFALTLAGRQIQVRQLEGTGDAVAKISDLRSGGVDVAWDEKAKGAVLTYQGQTLGVYIKPKHVTVGIAGQELRAFQGCTVVMKTDVSTGRNNSTPSGEFHAGTKSLSYCSPQFKKVPMPFSILVTKNIFLHGANEVPDHPSSDGCIRLTMPAAKALFQWIEVGTPINIE